MHNIHKLLNLYKDINLPKSKILLSLISITLIAVLSFFQPLVIKDITDSGLILRNVSVITSSVLILLLIVLSSQLIAVYQAQCFATIHSQVKIGLLDRALSKLLRLKLDFFTFRDTAEITNSLQTDIEQVASIVDSSFVYTATGFTRVLSGLVGLSFISWKLMLVVMLFVPIKILLVKRFSKYRQSQTSMRIKEFRTFFSKFGDTLNGIKEIKLWNLYKIKSQEVITQYKKIVRLNEKGVYTNALKSFFDTLLEWSLTGILYILGGFLLIKGELSVGSLVAFLTYSSYVTIPISSIINIRYHLAQIYPSAIRLCDFFCEEEEQINEFKKYESITTNLEIEFNNVSFGYAPHETVLDHANLVIPTGTKIAVIGANGSGKTTLTNLLLRFVSPSYGKITIGGVNIADFELTKYRDLFGVVSQESYFFCDTILNNIDLTHLKPLCQSVTALYKSDSESFVKNLPDEFDTRVGHNATTLSGGQKQKLSLARIIIKDAPIIILDEANSGLDIDSNRNLQKILTQEFAHKTVIMITHRLENLKYMDDVYQISSGKIEQVDKCAYL